MKTGHPFNRKTARRPSKGFTLVELMLVLVILGTLVALVGPRLTGKTEKANITSARTQISMLEEALDFFEIDNGGYPQEGDGLEALMVQPSNANNWDGPYLKKDIPLDPWGNAFIYEFPGRLNPDGFDLYSMGPNGQDGDDDDIGNWAEVK